MLKSQNQNLINTEEDERGRKDEKGGSAINEQGSKNIDNSHLLL